MESPIRPPRLRPGDRVGVVSPSGSVAGEWDRVERGIRRLEAMGLRVRLGRHVRADWHGLAGTHAERAADLNEMFADPEVRAVIATTGGAGCLPIVDRLDYAALAARPKLVLGISDVTVLLNAVHARTGLVTLHGPDVAYGFALADPGLEAHFLAVAARPEPAGPLPAWAGVDRVLRPGRAEGPLVGGNLAVLVHLAGTPYWPSLRGRILFLEGYGQRGAEVYRCLHRLRLTGDLGSVAGLVLGSWERCFEDDPDPREALRWVVLDACEGLDIPIVQIRGLGHNIANVTLPIGVRAALDEHGLRLLDPAVA
ncbi:S66 peptidase family protein [Caldinitratiruptor microaerophilus]|uniref:Carboxypeptidase n=1 Tax=Caldinitratiruptor microaerophilus TaxID=671077 RepID=A0AA35CL48_9FIRM|nr:LD-carboxypeptidase [Caldinitratiruptor microaerophilus]BDG59321.1 putative carboxypeptidase [Caldinitratiruptor microaerophilus]